MEFKAVDGNYARSECGRYTISRAPSSSSAVTGGALVYTLWAGDVKVAEERCKNYVDERSAAIALLQEAADVHAAGHKS